MSSTITLAQLILTCSLSASPHVNTTLHRVVMASSKGHPHWIATSKGHVYTPESLARASAVLEGMPHERFHLGLAALPSSRLRAMDVPLTHALEPCTNIGLASLEFETLLTSSTTKHIQAMHEALAAYAYPDRPEDVVALSFGARVLAMEEVDVEEEALSDDPRPGPTYLLEQELFSGHGTPSMLTTENSLTTPSTLFGTQGKPHEEEEPPALPEKEEKEDTIAEEKKKDDDSPSDKKEDS